MSKLSLRIFHFIFVLFSVILIINCDDQANVKSTIQKNPYVNPLDMRDNPSQDVIASRQKEAKKAAAGGGGEEEE